MVLVGTLIVGVCIVVVYGSVVVVVTCVGKDRCTGNMCPTLSTAIFRASSEYHSVSRALV